MQQYIDKAKILVEALPYIKEFNGITVVIKYGGSAMVNEEIKKTVIQDIALLKFVGVRPVIVHGGGPEINTMLKRLNIQSSFVNGLRVTDEDVMEVVEMVLAGKLNKAIAGALSQEGIGAVGICGRDGAMMRVKKKYAAGQDIGRVGEVEFVDTSLLQTLLNNDFVPVISPIGFDESGESYNINADYAAVAIAGALNAEKLVFLTDVDGVMRNVNDASSVLHHIKKDQALKMLNDGTISGGMIPKVECCLAGLNAGVQHVHILDGRVQHCLILEIFTKEGIGTLFEE